MLDTNSLSAGKCFFTASTQAEQQDVVINRAPFSNRSTSSRASLAVVISAPKATSVTFGNPAFLIAVMSCGKVQSNCPTIEGAIIATTGAPFLIRFKISINWLRSIIAPNGQASMQCPQEIHLSKSISATPFSPLWIASTGQACSHGTGINVIALYGQASLHAPQFLHLSASINERPSIKLIAPNLHACWHGRAKHPWHASVTMCRALRQPWQAISITVSGTCGIFVRVSASLA